MLVRAITEPFWHQPIRLAVSFKAWPAGAEGTMLGPPQVVEMRLGKDNLVTSFKLEVPVRMKGMAIDSMIPMELLTILPNEEYAQVFRID
ncbi:MAG: hypothetical protein WCV71_00315 [Patescibacteria group bacterium]|jgi:hypothetical protein